MAKFSIKAFITANTKGFKAGLDDAQKSLTNFGAELKKTLLAVGSFKVALKGVSSVTKFVEEATSEFAKANSAIVKGTGATGSAFANLSKSVQTAMKNGVGRSASEIGEMVADLNTRFGATGKELEKLIDEFDKFSDVTGVDTKQSIESLADVMAKWNVEASATDELMDQLVYASQASGLSVTELTSALKSGETTFNAFGMNITDSIGFLSQLKTQGVDTTSALSALKIGMAKFAASGEDVGEQFKKVSSQIQNATSDSKALQIAVNNFGAKGGADLVKVFKNNGLEDFISQLENAKGTLDNTEKASRTSADALKDLKAQIQATFFSGASDSYLTQIIDEIKIGFEGFDDDTMYDIFNNIYKAVQICVNSIDAIIHGDWETVWDYAKLVVLKLVNSVSKALQDMVDDLGIKVNVAAGVIGGLATGFGILTGNLAVAAAGVGVAVGTIIATNKNAMEQVSKDTQAEIDKTEKDIIARTDKNAKDGGEQLLKDLKRTQADIKTQTEKTGKLIENSAVPDENTIKKRLNSFTKGVKKGLESIIGEYKDVEDSAEAFNKLLENMGAIITNQVAGSFKTFFTQLGEELVAGGNAWENMTAIALDGVAQVLQALGQQLLALSAARAANYDYGTAAAAAAGAAAAFVASGAISAVASQMKNAADEANNIVASINTLKQKLNEIKNQASFESMYSDLSNLTTLLNTAMSTREFAKMNAQMWQANQNVFLAWKYGQEYWKLFKQANKEVQLIENSIRSYYESVQNNLQAVNEEIKNQIEYYDKLYSITNDIIEIGEGGIFGSFELESSFQKYKIMIQQQTNSIKESILSVFNEFSTIGTTIAGNIVDGIIEGTTKQDFASQLKSYLRENMIKLAVYTDEFSEKLGQSSTNFIIAMNTKNADLLATTRKELEELWDSAKMAASEAESFIDSVFGDIQENVESVIESAEEMGSSIADSLIDGLSSGLSEADFLETMKDYIKKLVVTSVVYTESLQAEIAAIGEAISNGIKEGFSETGLDEIRRDLSYIWYNANNAVSAIDSVLNNVFTGYATGTNNATAGLHLVGEAGPELVRFRGGEQVYNANDTRNMLQSGNVGGNNFNVTFNNMQDTSAFTMLQQMKQWQRDMAINGVI